MFVPTTTTDQGLAFIIAKVAKWFYSNLVDIAAMEDFQQPDKPMVEWLKSDYEGWLRVR